MPERDEPTPRWSGAQKREELQRQRAEERERAKQARLARESGDTRNDPGRESGDTRNDPGHDSGRRRLTDEERRTIREYRFPSASEQPARPLAPGDYPSPSAGASTPGSPPSGEEPHSPASPVGTKWRDSAPPGSTGGGGPSLPDLPGDDGSGGRRRPGNSRLIIFGLALFAIMIALAFTPLGPFGDQDDAPQVPTPSATLPSILGSDEADGEDVTDGIEQESEAVASEGQPIVCIDAGHGGWDTGWNRTDQGDTPYTPPIVSEAQINLGMAYMLKEELEANGIFVVMTRPSGAAVNLFDEDVNGDGETRLNAANGEQAGDRDELQARIGICNEAGADLLISLHVDGFDDRSARGFHVLYTAEREFGEQNATLATLVYRQMDTALRDTDMANLGRGARPDTEIDSVQYEFGTAQHFLILGPAVESISITPSEMPGIIVEAAFLSNDLDAVFIVQPSNQRLVVEAYAAGIMDFFEQSPPG